MSPLADLILFAVNLITFVLSLSILILAVWQNPGTATGRALIRFLATLAFVNITVILVFFNQLFFHDATAFQRVTTNLAVDAFAYSTMMAFALIVTAADKMKDALALVTRAGLVALVVLQWPLWTNQLFVRASDPATMTAAYTEAGWVAAAVNLIYVVSGLVAAWVWRRRINQPGLLVSLSLLLVSYGLTVLVPALREISFPSLIISVVGIILAYNLVRMQLFSPLSMRTAQLQAVRDLSQTMISRQGLQRVLDEAVHQARTLIRSGVALVMLLDGDNNLVVAAQNGGPKSALGRKLAPGEGLSGRVYQTQQAMQIATYRSWEGRSPVFEDLSFHCSLSVPMLDGDEAVGVLNIHELEPGRQYSDRERAVVEMLAAQAALGITHERLHYEVAYWRRRAQDADKSAPNPIRFDGSGKLIEPAPAAPVSTHTAETSAEQDS